MPRYVLTGAPGSGKTALLRQLELGGHAVVEEAATDIIAVYHALGEREPWRSAEFLDRIVALQRNRQLATRTDPVAPTFFDRSPVCTLALCRYAAGTASPRLRAELDRVLTGHLYERTVFFVRNQGFVEPTAARRISFEDSLAFERIHESTYRELGFDLVDVPPAPLPDRVALVEETVTRLARRLAR